jgi:hypothetical protein
VSGILFKERLGFVSNGSNVAILSFAYLQRKCADKVSPPNLKARDIV